MWKDIRFGLRQLRKSPAFTAIVLATLGLCIGANTAVYSVLDAVLLRPLPYPEADRLGLIVTQAGQGTQEAQTGALFEMVRDGAPGLDTAAYSGAITAANFAAGGRLAVVRQQRVSAGFFRVLGVAPARGREFTRAEDVPDGPALAVVSHEFWRRELGGNSGAVGKTILLRGEPFQVTGIMPRGFRTETPVDVWTPLRPSRQDEGAGQNYTVISRLRPGVSWAEAGGQLTAVSHFLTQMPGFPRTFPVIEARLAPYQDAMTGGVRGELLITWAAVLTVLAIGCANIAGLLLARSGARRREIATRLALGGSRWRIVRQLLAESLVLALGGCAVGIAVGAFSLDWLRSLGAQDFERWRAIELDARVMLAMLGITALTGVLFGLFPAIRISRLDVRAVLMEAGRSIAGRRRRWPENALVAGEVALSLVLLVTAGLLVRSLSYTTGLAPGFDPRNVMAAEASLQDRRYQSPESINHLFTASLERIRRLPGVESAAVALTLPYERPMNDSFLALDGESRRHAMAEMVYLTPGYFETMRIPLLLGRTVSARDNAEAGAVAVVSESFARRYFHGAENALGRHLQIDEQAREIVGVVGDVQQHSSLNQAGLPVSMDPTVYLPVAQLSGIFLTGAHRWFSPKWAMRVHGAPGTLETQVQAAVMAVDAGLPLSPIKTIAQFAEQYTGGQRYLASLFAVLAGLAVLLAAIGIYGTISQAITRRRHELGVRIALGAPVRQTLAHLAMPGLRLAALGIGAGLVLARFAVRFLEHLLFGVGPGDPLTFLAMAVLLLLVAAGSSLAAGARILRMDPAETLRSD
ncbi:MAG: ABC transporter permease [Candidatus Sulfopaludibacter sp.]|nr:ABC transporter permease [Candidatus Sulfopaludibacter sp.]